MLSVKGITKKYGNITALDDVSFDVKNGSVVGFLGANGAGKTTTMDIICGCAGCDKGTVSVEGADIALQPLEAKRQIGYLPDEPPIYTDMYVYDYIEYAAQLRGVPRTKIKSRIEEVIDRLNIGNVRKRIVGNLSKGYKQRVGLAQALVHDPKILILDEPTEGLDPSQIVQIRELIKSLGEDHTILISSHILSEVQNTCDHLVIINQGKIVEQGSFAEISSKAKESRGYTLVIAGGASECSEKIKDLPSINGSSVRLISNDTIEFDFAGDVVPTDLINVAMGYGIKQIKANVRNLEDIFLKLTR